MKKQLVGAILSGIMAISMLTGTTAFASDSTEGNDVNGSDITIGVSIWGTNDSLGASIKKILDTEADTLGVKLVYVEQNLKSEEVVASAENLCASGVDGIIMCNSADAEMAQVIPTCQQNKVYVAQFFRKISDDNILKLAEKSPYYLGTTHEDEEKNGYDLGTILIKDKGCRDLGMISYRVGDATANERMVGYKKAVEDWNKDNPDDQVKLGDVVDDKQEAEDARQAVEGMIDADQTMDGLIVVGGGGKTLQGALEAIKSKNKVGDIKVCSTDFPDNLKDLLADNEVAAMSGGHYADPFFSLMMVYNAVRGNFVRPDDNFFEIKFPMMYVSSVEDYENYDKYFVQSLPYNEEEIKAISDESFEDLQKTAADLSIEDAAKRHGGQ